MKTYAFLAGAMLMTTPALSQQTASPASSAPATTSVPATAASTTASADSSTAAASPAQPASVPPAADPQTAQATAQPVASGSVKQVVDSEFASYDKDGNGSLDKAEFAAWMTALKAADGAKHDAAADTKWNEAAFAQADKDKSKSLSKTELAGFLGQGKNAS